MATPYSFDKQIHKLISHQFEPLREPFQVYPIAHLLSAAAIGWDLQTSESVEIGDYLRRSGLYILGKSGMGKTSLLVKLIEQDIKNGHGVFFLDPHGDGVENILRRCDLAGRTEQITILDPESETHSFALNPLACPDIASRSARRETYNRAYKVFYKLWQKDFEERPWLQLIIEFTLPIFIENQAFTLAEIPLFFRNAVFRNHLVSNLKYSQEARDFWEGDFAARSKRDQDAQLDAARTRVLTLLGQADVRDIVGSPRSTIDFTRIIEDRGIILVKLPAKLAPDTKKFIGTILINELLHAVTWDDKPATVTTTTFKRIKDYVIGLKKAEPDGETIVTPGELRGRLQATDADWRFTDAEMMTAVGHLENYGYVKRLRTSRGEERVLLEPERLNNLASSLVLEARRNPKGLGALEEKRLLASGYAFPELTDLHEDERAVLLDTAALLFLEHHVCFRETDPLRMEPYLVFPELINLKKPLEEEQATEDSVAYTVNGPTENVFASLVVLLGYTHTFTRTNQWQNNARYEVGEGLVCGFRQEAERDGELDFVLCFGAQAGPPVRTLFQGLFESFLARRNLTVRRYEPVRCSNAACGQLLDRSIVRQRMKEKKAFTFCNECGEKLMLPAMAEPIQLTREVQGAVDSQRRVADQRTRFEQAVFSVQAYVAEQGIRPPECFISYAWGVPKHERWVEKRLATDLQKAGIGVVLDRWHNTQIGASVARFVERIENSDRIVMVGTPLYRHKYQNKDTSTGYVVAAEVDLIANRLIGTETQKESVLPLLLDGEKTASLPPLLHGRVYADFREEAAYFTTAFDLILSLYQLPPHHPAVADLCKSLRGPKMMWR